MPKMKHESGGRQIDATPDMVPMYESQGWREVTPATPTKKAAAKKAVAKPSAGKK